MSNTLIRKALNSVVEELSVSLNTSARPIKVNWENVGGDHANGSGVYLEPYLLPAPTQFVGFQQKGRIYAGVYQVAVVFPAGTGTQYASELADAIATSDKWLAVKISGAAFQLQDAPYTSSVVEDVDRARIVVTVPYTCCA
ncbi:hypothetical protein EE09_23 [Escherichia phage vB_EcoS-EE09]|nr:hypothetical protein EE09_23 [Escherichia phage vB_EcoS-EE09]